MPPYPIADLDHVLAHTAPVWDAMRNSRIFITGGTGFFGRWLLESFIWANTRLRLNAEAVVLTRNPEAFTQSAPHLAANPAINLFPGTVTDFCPPPGPFRYVIHAATTSGSAVTNLIEMFDTIVTGTRRVLEAAVIWQAKGVLLTSSGAVYGRQPPELSHLPETHPGGPDALGANAAYAEGKRAAECLAGLFHQQHGLRTVISRGFAFVGPGLPLDAHFAIGNFLRDGLAGRPIRVGGDGTPFRSYLHAADLAVWLWNLLMRGKPAQAYNTGSDVAVSIRELAETVGAMFGVPVEVAREPVPGVAPERYVPSIEKARTELGLDVRISHDDALTRTIRWHQTQ